MQFYTVFKLTQNGHFVIIDEIYLGKTLKN